MTKDLCKNDKNQLVELIPDITSISKSLWKKLRKCGKIENLGKNKQTAKKRVDFWERL